MMATSTVHVSRLSGPTGNPVQVVLTQDVVNWNSQQVVLWLEEIKCAKHADIFLKSKISGAQLLSLDSEKLLRLGIPSLTERAKILVGLRKLIKVWKDRERWLLENAPHLLPQSPLYRVDSATNIDKYPESSPTSPLTLPSPSSNFSSASNSPSSTNSPSTLFSSSAAVTNQPRPRSSSLVYNKSPSRAPSLDRSPRLNAQEYIPSHHGVLLGVPQHPNASQFPPNKEYGYANYFPPNLAVSPVTPLSHYAVQNKTTPAQHGHDRPSADVISQNIEAFFPESSLEMLKQTLKVAKPAAITSTPGPRGSSLKYLQTKYGQVNSQPPSPILNPTRYSPALHPQLSASPAHSNNTFSVNSQSSYQGSTNGYPQQLSMNRGLSHPRITIDTTNVPSNSPKPVQRVTVASPEDTEDDNGSWIKGELIGAGSYGKVYLGVNRKTGAMMAVKSVEFPQSEKRSKRNQNMIEALQRETDFLQNLSHPHIVQCLGFDFGESCFSIFLEYVPGGSLSSLLRKIGEFDEVLTRFFMKQIAEGLKYLHQNGILHRDIKCANLLVDDDGCLKISDFGLSKSSRQLNAYDMMSQMSFQGSVYWMAPEMVKSSGFYSAKVDIWSVGCVMIEMLTGERPWIGMHEIAAMYQLGQEQIPPIPEKWSEDAKDFAKWCFEIDPEKRPTAEQLGTTNFCSIEDAGFDYKSHIAQTTK